MTRARLHGLYAITSPALVVDGERLLAACAAALRGGARVLQYRDKANAADVRADNARRLLALCRNAGALLIINDDPELATRVGADGVHVGADDASVALARERLGPRAIVGATCGNSLARALAAVDAGADYVAFGRFFASTTKPDAPPADLDTLRMARARLRVPVCAIGGITPDNAPALIDAGADLIAAIAGVFDADDVEAAARRYAQLFT